MGRGPYVAQLLPLASLAPVAATVTGGAGDSLAVAIGADPPLRVRVDAAGNNLAAGGGGRARPVTPPGGAGAAHPAPGPPLPHRPPPPGPRRAPGHPRSA